MRVFLKLAENSPKGIFTKVKHYHLNFALKQPINSLAYIKEIRRTGSNREEERRTSQAIPLSGTQNSSIIYHHVRLCLFKKS